MSDDKVVAAGKSKEEIAHSLMFELLIHCTDSPGHKHSREDVLRHYLAARAAVYGDVLDSALKHLQ